MKKLLLSVLLSVVSLSACAPAEEESVDIEGCEHLQEGPATSVAATTAATGAPAVRDDHRRYDVALADVTGGRGGSVSFAVAEAGDYVIFLGADVPLAVTDPAGAAVEAEEHAKSSTVCTDIKSRSVFPLAQVGTYTLTFGPTTAATVSVVIEHAAHAHDHAE
ncbi:MAG: hypothetical protein L0Y66_17630 [Myxococcaceae bacterium]|nr:hypothetical protein [Myxococcaceae bacterium]MCI0669355.1 hypothetical protein [Myxococcaceae bacterium]